MASAELSRRVEKVVGYPPLSEMSGRQRREFHEALLDAATFEDPSWKVAGGSPGRGTEPAEAAARVRRVAAPNEVLPSIAPSERLDA